MVSGKVIVEKIEQCGDASNYKIKFNSHLREEGGVQIAGGTLKTDIETGDNVEVSNELAPFKYLYQIQKVLQSKHHEKYETLIKQLNICSYYWRHNLL